MYENPYNQPRRYHKKCYICANPDKLSDNERVPLCLDCGISYGRVFRSSVGDPFLKSEYTEYEEKVRLAKEIKQPAPVVNNWSGSDYGASFHILNLKT